MDTITTFRTRADRFARVLAEVGDHWDAPTPCPDWTVADVVAHVIDTERDFLAKQQLPLPELGDSSDPLEAWQVHSAAVLDVLSAEGTAARRYDGYFGPTTVGDTMADFYGWDLAVHAWDVARATGQDNPISDEEAARLDTTADGWGAALHSEGVCGPEVTVDADAGPAERLLARLGRDPQWTARRPG